MMPVRFRSGPKKSTFQRLRSVRAEEIDPKIANHRVRLVKTTGIGLAHRIRRRCRCTTLCCRGGVGDASAQLGFRSALTPISANFFMPPKETGPDSGSRSSGPVFRLLSGQPKSPQPGTLDGHDDAAHQWSEDFEAEADAADETRGFRRAHEPVGAAHKNGRHT